MMNKSNKPESAPTGVQTSSQSFIVNFWSSVFALLGRLSVFSLVRLVYKGAGTAKFVDAWVLGHLVLSFVSVVLVSTVNLPKLVAYGLVVYGFIRVFEVAIYQTNVMLFDEHRALSRGPNATYAVESYRRMVVLLLHNYVEIIFWLACTYTVLANHYTHKWEAGTGTLLGGIYSSFITMTTFGDFDLAPQTDLAAMILLFHASVGLLMTLLSLARFIGFIPKPDSKDPTESD
jgi:hypothetical protein